MARKQPVAFICLPRLNPFSLQSASITRIAWSTEGVLLLTFNQVPTFKASSAPAAIYNGGQGGGLQSAAIPPPIVLHLRRMDNPRHLKSGR